MATLICGFDDQLDKFQIFQTDPAGTFTEWKANVVGGKNEKTIKELLEAQYQEDMSKEACLEFDCLIIIESIYITFSVCVYMCVCGCVIFFSFFHSLI